MNLARWAVVAVVAAVALVLSLVWWGGREDGSSRAAPQAGPSPAATPTSPAARTKPVGRRAVLAPGGCASTAAGPFAPTRISVEGVTPGVPVLALPRDARDVPGVPPVSTAGKQVFAWDAPGVAPGAARGNVLLNAHTWPDGSAMGNALLRSLDEGDGFALSGEGGRRLCYRVVDRVEVSVDAPTGRVYDESGPPQAVIIVCSGTRLGPGNWSHRMLWFARPVT